MTLCNDLELLEVYFLRDSEHGADFPRYPRYAQNCIKSFTITTCYNCSSVQTWKWIHNN